MTTPFPVRLLSRLVGRNEARVAGKDRPAPDGEKKALSGFEWLEAYNRSLLDAIIEDENEPRTWRLVVIGTDKKRHEIPVRCSRKQVRKIKLAVFDAGGDALAVETSATDLARRESALTPGSPGVVQKGERT